MWVGKDWLAQARITRCLVSSSTRLLGLLLEYGLGPTEDSHAYGTWMQARCYFHCILMAKASPTQCHRARTLPLEGGTISSSGKSTQAQPVSSELSRASLAMPYISQDGFSRALSSSLRWGYMETKSYVLPFPPLLHTYLTEARLLTSPLNGLMSALGIEQL